MAKILIGTPSIHPDARYLKSLPLFYKELSEKHYVDHFTVCGQKMDQAQNEIANIFMQGSWSYLLFLEDDHWGFTAKMVEDLIELDRPVSTVATFSRYAPYWTVPMRYSKLPTGELTADKSVNQMYESGQHEADMIGMYFCLIKREVFQYMSRPYFVSDKEDGRQTDRVFCKRLMDEQGIKPWADFDHIIPHADITKENVWEKRVEAITKQQSRRVQCHSI